MVVDLNSAEMVAGRLALLLQGNWPVNGIWYCRPTDVDHRNWQELGRGLFGC